MKRFLALTGVGLALAGVGLWQGSRSGPRAKDVVWGIDACLSIFVDRDAQRAYVDLLQGSGVKVLRERGVPFPNAAGAPHPQLTDGHKGVSEIPERLRELKAAGFQIVAFATLPPEVKATQPGNVLPENLAEVFAGGKRLAELYAGVVDAWEMVGEPDVGYCFDLPDRVAAYQKALYLGIKAGSGAEKPEGGNLKPEGGNLKPEGGNLKPESGEPKHGALKPRSSSASESPQVSGLSVQESASAQPSGFRSPVSPIVAMGALALPPGPWLDRAARNGLLDYTDAYNFHSYAYADHFRSTVLAHKRWLRSQGREDLPLWLTECGINSRNPAAPEDPQRLALQADFTLRTAREARRQGIAVFMPFILVHRGDPHALTEGPDKLKPAWGAYAQFTREAGACESEGERGEGRPESRNLRPETRNLKPETRNLRPEGANGSGARPVTGGRAHAPASLPVSSRGAQPSPVVVQWLHEPASATPHKVSGTYRTRGAGPIRGVLRWYNFGSEPIGGRWRWGGLTRFACSLPAEVEVTIPPGGVVEREVEFHLVGEGYAQEWFAGDWADRRPGTAPLYFGLEKEPAIADFVASALAFRDSPPRYERSEIVRDERTSRAGPWAGLNGVKLESADAGRIRLHTEKLAGALFGDPLHPGFAIAGVHGLPKEGFLRLRLSEPMARGWIVWVYLVDDQGRRFTIWENAGVGYWGSREEVWLNLRDFSPWWERLERDGSFDPSRVKAILLRVDSGRTGVSRELQLDLLQPRRLGAAGGENQR